MVNLNFRCQPFNSVATHLKTPDARSNSVGVGDVKFNQLSIKLALLPFPRIKINAHKNSYTPTKRNVNLHCRRSRSAVASGTMEDRRDWQPDERPKRRSLKKPICKPAKKASANRLPTLLPEWRWAISTLPK
jgi:hypothetical protein